mmetsp:Transcript_66421/g.175205  ORF Transcript_66421/g.175205 Transcript_66421/m.175205 type:complete len:217 (-) Transcript_66421:236-886(-)
MEVGACHPFLIVRRSELVSVDDFGAEEHDNPRILPCTCLTQRHRKIFDTRELEEVEKVKRGGEVSFNCGSDAAPLLIKGDTKFILYDKEKLNNKRTICHFWVHTHFLVQQQCRMVLRRRDTDKASKSKYDDKFPPDFEIVLEAEPYEDEEKFSFASFEYDGRKESHDSVGEGDGEGGGDTDDDTDEEEMAEDVPHRTPRTMLGMLNNKRRDYTTSV